MKLSAQGTLMTNSSQNGTVVHVAVAVIHYHDQYLLGFRSHKQHQGNRYEFVGGKIDAGETAVAALVREVNEEVGIDIANNICVKLGRLHHDYGDKQVCLHVYDVTLTMAQYKQHQQCHHGREGQALTWVNKVELVANHYSLPAANLTILAWLQLPKQIAITYPLAHFTAKKDAFEAWLTYHQQHLPKSVWVYVRIKPEYSKDVIKSLEITKSLIDLRLDIQAILPDTHSSQVPLVDSQVVATHLTHSQLMTWFKDYESSKNHHQESQSISLDSLLLSHSSNHPMIVSCHNAENIQAANQLAALRLQHKLSPVIGVFLSPVLATQTHPEVEPLGWELWSLLAELSDMPVIGLGGLSPSLSKQASHYGATSIAGIRQFLLI